MQILSTGEAPPAATSAAPADVATGGSLADDYESVIVTVSNVTVTAVNNPGNEYTVDSTLIVDDFLYLTTPFPVVSQTYTSLTGVVALFNSDSKLLPRGASDVVP